MKKTVIISAIIIAIAFIGGAFWFTNKNNETAEESNYNPYNKTNLNPETVKLLSDKNYQEIIVPEDLDKKFANKESFVVYYFSPLCDTCREATPIMMPIAKELGVEVVQMNFLEYEEGWKKYGVEQTPSLVVYKDGVEVTRSTGNLGEEGFRTFFDQWVKGN